MKKIYSLSAKLVLMGVTIGALVPALGLFAYYKSTRVAALNREISDVKLEKTKELGDLVVKFRDIRLQIRTVPVRGMEWGQVDEYLVSTQRAVADFLAAKKLYSSTIENVEERKLYDAFDASSNDFLEFGKNLIELSSAHEDKKIDEVSLKVRETCPVKAALVEKDINALIGQQTVEAKALVAAAHSAKKETDIAILIGSIFGFGVAIFIGWRVARAISRELQTLATELSEGANKVTGAAQQVSADGDKLSSSVTQQAAALQETVTAIEEISSMIAKNSENAKNSRTTAASSLEITRGGQALVHELIGEIEEIQKSTVGLMSSVKQGNQEITRIVNVINEIESKTKVINDIVFQTKLLSFNASVEAARAGEAGKGFAVVAEEVGNLAALSGRSAKEIAELLASSVQMVQQIVTSTQERVERQALESKARVDHGIELGKRCGDYLVKILDGAERVNDMVTDIASASQEQSTGVSEVTKAMHQMDQLTQENASVSSSSAIAAEQLSGQADEMKSLVDRLYGTIQGDDSTADRSSAPVLAIHGKDRAADDDVRQAA